MALNCLSPPQRTAAPEDFDADDVRAFIAGYLGIDVGRVTDEARFGDDLGAGWLDRLELMILIEDVLVGVEIADDDADQIEVVGDLIRHIEIANNERRGAGTRRHARQAFRKVLRPQSAVTVWKPPGKTSESRTLCRR